MGLSLNQHTFYTEKLAFSRANINGNPADKGHTLTDVFTKSLSEFTEEPNGLGR